MPDFCTGPMISCAHFGESNQCELLIPQCQWLVGECIGTLTCQQYYDLTGNCPAGYDCTLPLVYGCTDPAAANYDSTATGDDGSCVECEYNFQCTSNLCMNNFCTEAMVSGCTNSTATNYNPDATVDDGSCQYPPPPTPTPPTELTVILQDGTSRTINIADCLATGCPNVNLPIDGGSWTPDGMCDPECNNATCGWDMGDCCSDTCVDLWNDCGSINDTYGTSYQCLDPTSADGPGLGFNCCELSGRLTNDVPDPYGYLFNNHNIVERAVCDTLPSCRESGEIGGDTYFCVPAEAHGHPLLWTDIYGQLEDPFNTEACNFNQTSPEDDNNIGPWYLGRYSSFWDDDFDGYAAISCKNTWNSTWIDDWNVDTNSKYENCGETLISEEHWEWAIGDNSELNFLGNQICGNDGADPSTCLNLWGSTRFSLFRTRQACEQLGNSWGDPNDGATYGIFVDCVEFFDAAGLPTFLSGTDFPSIPYLIDLLEPTTQIDPPVATDIILSTDIITPITFTPTCTDTDYSNLYGMTYTVVTPEYDTGGGATNPGYYYGNVTPSGGQIGPTTFTYTPDLYASIDEGQSVVEDFSFTCFDGINTTEGGISITIGDANDPPTASQANIFVNQNETITRELTCTDEEGDTLSYWIKYIGGANPDSGGTLQLDGVEYSHNGEWFGGTSGGVITYRASTGYYGTDSFKWKCNDGVNDSAEESVNITIRNNIPITPPTLGPFTSDLGREITFDLECTVDPNGAGQLPNTYMIFYENLGGAISPTGLFLANDEPVEDANHFNHYDIDDETVTIIYKPRKHFYGNDMFVYQCSAQDGVDGSYSTPTTVNIDVLHYEESGSFGVPGVTIKQSLSQSFDPFSGIDIDLTQFDNTTETLESADSDNRPSLGLFYTKDDNALDKEFLINIPDTYGNFSEYESVNFVPNPDGRKVKSWTTDSHTYKPTNWITPLNPGRYWNDADVGSYKYPEWFINEPKCLSFEKCLTFDTTGANDPAKDDLVQAISLSTVQEMIEPFSSLYVSYYQKTTDLVEGTNLSDVKVDMFINSLSLTIHNVNIGRVLDQGIWPNYQWDECDDCEGSGVNISPNDGEIVYGWGHGSGYGWPPGSGCMSVGDNYDSCGGASILEIETPTGEIVAGSLRGYYNDTQCNVRGFIASGLESGSGQTTSDSLEAYIMYVGSDENRFNIIPSCASHAVVIAYWDSIGWTYDNNNGYDATRTFEIDYESDLILGRVYRDDDTTTGISQYKDYAYELDSLKSGSYNSLENIDVSGSLATFANSEEDKWEKMEYTFNMNESWLTNVSTIGDMRLWVRAHGMPFDEDNVGGKAIVWLDNFEVREGYHFVPDVDVRKKKSSDNYGVGSLTEYYDPSIQPQEYEDTSAPLEAQFYFYPRYNIDQVFTHKDIIHNDFREGQFYLYDVDWGDGAPNEFVPEPLKLGDDVAVHHTYERSGIYEVVGYMLRIKSNEEGQSQGVVHNKRFTVRINVNEGLDDDFTFFGTDGFSFLPYKSTTPIVGGISTNSAYYKSIKRQLGFISDDIKVSPYFKKSSDQLKTEIALQKIEDNLYRGYNQWKVDYYQHTENLTYTLDSLPTAGSPTLTTFTDWSVTQAGGNSTGRFDDVHLLFQNTDGTIPDAINMADPSGESHGPTNFTVRYSTWIYVNESFSVDTGLTSDNNGYFYINEVLIASDVYDEVATADPYTYDFVAGNWYKLDLVLNEGVGGDFITMGWRIDTASQITEGGVLNFEILPSFQIPRYSSTPMCVDMTWEHTHTNEPHSANEPYPAADAWHGQYGYDDSHEQPWAWQYHTCDWYAINHDNPGGDSGTTECNELPNATRCDCWGDSIWEVTAGGSGLSANEACCVCGGGELSQGNLIYTGDLYSSNKEELGKSIGDTDVSNIRYFNTGSIQMWELLGFDEEEAGIPDSPRYWKNIISEDYTMFARAGVVLSLDSLTINDVLTPNGESTLNGELIPPGQGTAPEAFTSEDGSLVIPFITDGGQYPQVVDNLVYWNYENTSVSEVASIFNIEDGIISSIVGEGIITVYIPDTGFLGTLQELETNKFYIIKISEDYEGEIDLSPLGDPITFNQNTIDMSSLVFVDVINVQSPQEWMGQNEYGNTYYYPVLPKLNRSGKFDESLGLQQNPDGTEKIPFGHYIEDETNWNDVDTEAYITREQIPNDNSLIIDIGTESVDINTLEDKGQKALAGFSISDYKVEFDTETNEPKQRKSTKRIKTIRGRNRAF